MTGECSVTSSETSGTSHSGDNPDQRVGGKARFDFGAQAELFAMRHAKARRGAFGYRRFAHAAEAIRFAIEELPPALLLGAFLEVEEARFDCQGIRRLYEHDDYPFAATRGSARTKVALVGA